MELHCRPALQLLSLVFPSPLGAALEGPGRGSPGAADTPGMFLGCFLSCCAQMLIVAACLPARLDGALSEPSPDMSQCHRGPSAFRGSMVGLRNLCWGGLRCVGKGLRACGDQNKLSPLSRALWKKGCFCDCSPYIISFSSLAVSFFPPVTCYLGYLALSFTGRGDGLSPLWDDEAGFHAAVQAVCVL